MKTEVGGKRLSRQDREPGPGITQFIARVRRVLRSGVETFEGRVWMQSRVVFQTGEFESKQHVQAEIAAWAQRRGKRNCIEWLYV